MEGRGFPCVRCGVALPLVVLAAEGAARSWRCRRCGAAYFASLAVDASPEQAARVELADFQDAAAQWNLADDHGQPFLAAGAATRALPPRRRVICHRETPVTRRLDDDVDRGVCLRTPRLGRPYRAGLTRPEPAPYAPAARRRMARLFQSSFAKSQQAFQLARQGDGWQALQCGMDVVRGALNHLADDVDLFACLSVNPPLGGYPSRHALHAAALAMILGVELGWDERALAALGVGCFLHDAGMLHVERAVHQRASVLSAAEFRLVAEHPLHTLDFLQEAVDAAPPAARVVAYQMHERCDGSGYPRGRSREKISDLARIAAVANAYVALVSPRPHRDGLSPYHAVVQLLQETKSGAYDAQVVRALLHAISLFPLGSRVLLSDGRVGRVIRVNGKQYTRPVVEILRPDGGRPTQVVDLAAESTLQVAKPVMENNKASEPAAVA